MFDHKRKDSGFFAFLSPSHSRTDSKSNRNGSTSPKVNGSVTANGQWSDPVRTPVVAAQPPEPLSPSKLDELMSRMGGALDGFKKAFKAVRAPLPTDTGDGTALLPPPETSRELAEDLLKDILKDGAKLGITTVAQLIDAGMRMANKELIDDREYLMELMVKAAATIPDDQVSGKLTDNFVTTLWNDLQHPPHDLLGEEYQYRQPDGSNNCYERPNIGKAGMPYARTVAPQVEQRATLPDPYVLFDTLMARKQPTEHPNKISSMLFYLASIIIHDIFKTDHVNCRISKTSSYLDLAPLYGSNWKEQKRMRTFKDGKLHPDCFSETRLLGFPPGVGAILIMFNRYHNWVVEQLAAINENHKFDDKNLKVYRNYDDSPEKSDEDQPVEQNGDTQQESTGRANGEKKMKKPKGVELDKRDEDLFQTARLITCGLYINIILIDYVRTILNLNRTDNNWQLDPRKKIPNLPVGTGNQVSAEFNLVYRWHSAVSANDEVWTEKLMQQMCPGVDPADLKVDDLLQVLRKTGEAEYKQEPYERQFPALNQDKLTRNADGPYKGSFKDDDLAKILTDGIEDCANAMGPHQVPVCMRVIEVMGMQQARTWQLATLNEFRKHFGLLPHQHFSDITKNAEVAEALKHLYDTPDQVELYPGLVVEDAKDPKLPGSGLCPSYTTSRGVLSDAVALVRGDRFYTSSYTPAALTNWGFKEAASEPAIDNGCVFYKLFLRALPNNYDPASVYVHYPMTIPTEMKTVLTGLGKADKYNFDEPQSIAPPTVIFSYAAADKIVHDQETFKVTWGKAMTSLMHPAAKNFMLAGDDAPNAKSRKLMEDAMYLGGSSTAIPKGNEKWLEAVKSFYEETTTRLLKEKKYKLGKLTQVDLIREVGNKAHVHFAAELFSLPLKTKDFPHGLFTEYELYLIFAAVFICVFFDIDPPKSFGLRQTAKEVTQLVGGVIEAQVKAVNATGRLAVSLIDRIRPTDSNLKDYGIHMIQKLCKANPDAEDLVWGNIMGTCGGMVANQGQLFGQTLDYMFTEGQEHIPEINRLAKEDTPEAFDTLMHYLLEFSRLNGETGVFREVARDVTVEDNGKTHQLKKGDRVMVNFKAASRDPKMFPNPDKVDLTRPIDSYIHFGHGPHQCLGLPMTRVALTTMLKVIGRLDNLRPADIAVGRVSEKSKVKKVVKEFVPGDLKEFPETWHYHAFLTEDWEMFFPFPTSLKVNWDE